MTVNVKPIGDKILVKRKDEETVTKSGIVIPDTAKEKPQEAEVVAVGPGKILDNGTKVPMEVKPGDVVLMSKYGGTEIKIEGPEYLIIEASDVLAIVGK